MTTGAIEADASRSKPDSTLIEFLVENDNEGTEIAIEAPRGDRIQAVIDNMYAGLGRGHLPGDRLTLISDGSNVFESAGSTVAAYYAHTHHEEPIRWSFVGEQGGANQ